MDDSLGAFGPFDLLIRLGQGGMGEVWKARRRDGDGARYVVVKRVLPHLSGDAEIVRMFQREARLCALLDHPNLVRVLDYGEVAGELYLEMDYVDGIDVVRLMRGLQGTGTPPGAAAYTVAAVARALAYAHALKDERGQPLHLVHRDVTPSNVMIGFRGEVKLLDFGVAKILAEASESRTATGTLKGKFGYMAPEQVEGAPAMQASDQFSAGVILYEMLTGRRLFRGENDVQTLARVKAAIVDAPSRHNQAVPDDLDAICLRALERTPEQRYPDCAALAGALEEVAARLGWSAAQHAAFAGGNEPTRIDGTPALLLALDRMPRGTVRAQAPATTLPKRMIIVAGSALLLVAGVLAVRMRSTAAPVPVAPAPITSAPLPAPPVVSPTTTVSSTPAPAARPPGKTKSAGPRIVQEKPSRKRAPMPPAPASTAVPARATASPGTSSGKVRAGQIFDPFAR